MTPHSVHYGHAAAHALTRQAALDAAFLAIPSASRNGSPQPPALPTAAWINPPTKENVTDLTTHALHSKFMTPGGAKSLTRSGNSGDQHTTEKAEGVPLDQSFQHLE